MSRARKPKVVEISPTRSRIFSGPRVIGEVEFYEASSDVPVGSFWGATVNSTPAPGFHATRHGAIDEVISMNRKSRSAGR